MLKDARGEQLELGDQILIPARIKSLYQNIGIAGHIQIELDYSIWKDGPPSTMTVVSNQVLKA